MNNEVLVLGAIVADDRVWLLHKIKTGELELPGGKFDSLQDKSLEDTVIREIGEELDYRVKVKGYFMENFLSTSETKYDTYIFLVEPLSSEFPRIRATKDFDVLRLINVSDYDKYLLSAPALDFCKKYVSDHEQNAVNMYSHVQHF